MINILGTYECKADSKGRIMLPSPLKKQIASVISDGFVVKRSVFNKCLEIHPMSEWNKIYKTKNRGNRKKSYYKYVIFEQFEIDIISRNVIELARDESLYP